MKTRFAAFAGTVRRIVGILNAFVGGALAALHIVGMSSDFDFYGSSWCGVMTAILIAGVGVMHLIPNSFVGQIDPSNTAVNSGGRTGGLWMR